MNTAFRKPDCTYNPYDFEGETEYKKTCLWLKGLQPLKTNDLPKPELPKRTTKSGKLKSITWGESVNKDRAKNRSKTFVCIANAMAEQWG